MRVHAHVSHTQELYFESPLTRPDPKRVSGPDTWRLELVSPLSVHVSNAVPPVNAPVNACVSTVPWGCAPCGVSV
jgi:hypothetical protein